MADYVIATTVTTGQEETIERVKEALAGEGFGVLSEIMVHETLKEKIGADLIVMDEDARIGYMPVRVWGCPTTAMWVYRLGPQRAVLV